MINQIVIGFSKPKNRVFPFGSWLIRAYEKTPFSHVYLKFHSETLNRTLVYEAVGGGVRFIGNKAWENHAEEVSSFTLDIKQCNYITLLQYCVDHAGMEYGFAQNLGVVVCDLLKLEKNPFKKGKNCSEVVGEILKLEGIHISKDTNLLTPKDIYEALHEIKS